MRLYVYTDSTTEYAVWETSKDWAGRALGIGVAWYKTISDQSKNANLRPLIADKNFIYSRPLDGDVDWQKWRAK